jgi:hypothetical protein
MKSRRTGHTNEVALERAGCVSPCLGTSSNYRSIDRTAIARIGVQVAQKNSGPREEPKRHSETSSSRIPPLGPPPHPDLTHAKAAMSTSDVSSFWLVLG